ncbi:hypothetical protein ACXV6R_004165 [Yersinia enterocolitica]
MGKVMDFLNAVSDELTSKQVKVGFLAGATYPDGTSVPMVAASNEFGNPASGSPPRPFFRNAISENSGKWAENTESLMKHHEGNTELVLNLMGEIIKDDVMRSIGALVYPAISPVTVLLRDRFPMRDGMTFDDVLAARKDVNDGITGDVSNKPLIWTGHMQSSVDYEVGEIESTPDS